MSVDIEQIRIAVPEKAILDRGTADSFFDCLPNNQGLTEEYLYAHQPTTAGTIAVYSTSPNPIGYLDDTLTVREKFNVLEGPVIIVARKGYAGRLYVVESDALIVHEDA